VIAMAIRRKKLFTVPIKKTHLAETEILKQRFLPDMLQRYKAQQYEKPKSWTTDRIHTSFSAKDSNDHPMVSMPEEYVSFVQKAIPPARFTVELWHNIYWTGQEYQEIHHHVPCHLSMIHFLSFDKTEHKPPVFYDPARLIKATCNVEGVPEDFWQDRYSIPVEEGDVVIFPSYVEHYIPPGNYVNPRVTVSMNITFVGG
jgi:hypothetical protein